MKSKMCCHCGFVGEPIMDGIGSLTIDLVAWLSGIVLLAMTGTIYFVALGPMVSIWHLFTFRSHRCPKCRRMEMRNSCDLPNIY